VNSRNLRLERGKIVRCENGRMLGRGYWKGEMLDSISFRSRDRKCESKESAEGGKE